MTLSAGVEMELDTETDPKVLVSIVRVPANLVLISTSLVKMEA